jgi:hypothetical protein
LQNAHSYYQPPPLPPDGLDPASLIILLIFIGFIVALLWLIYWEPEKPKKKDDKTLRQKIEDAFTELSDNAVLYNRGELVGPVGRARAKVIQALNDSGQ